MRQLADKLTSMSSDVAAQCRQRDGGFSSRRLIQLCRPSTLDAVDGACHCSTLHRLHVDPAAAVPSITSITSDTDHHTLAAPPLYCNNQLTWQHFLQRHLATLIKLTYMTYTSTR